MRLLLITSTLRLKLCGITWLIILIFSNSVGATSNTLKESFDKKSDDRILKIDDFYFISGEPNAKVNFTFGIELSKTYKLDFLFNQTMFWEFGKSSMPFDDVNYNPQIRKRFNLKALQIDLGIWEHHSNGTAGDSSRSYDGSYILGKYHHEVGKWSFYSGIKLRSFYRAEDNNSDVEKIYGNVELSESIVYEFGKDQKNIQLNFAISPGGDYSSLFNFGYKRVDLIINPRFADLPIKLHAQLYNGYGESLINYDIKDQSYRLGISI